MFQELCFNCVSVERASGALQRKVSTFGRVCGGTDRTGPLLTEAFLGALILVWDLKTSKSSTRKPTTFGDQLTAFTMNFGRNGISHGDCRID
jgi:hypothetical protein